MAQSSLASKSANLLKTSLTTNRVTTSYCFPTDVEKEEGNIIDRVETAIDVVSLTHNVSTNVVYDYINKETGE